MWDSARLLLRQREGRERGAAWGDLLHLRSPIRPCEWSWLTQGQPHTPSCSVIAESPVYLRSLQTMTTSELGCLLLSWHHRVTDTVLPPDSSEHAVCHPSTLPWIEKPSEHLSHRKSLESSDNALLNHSGSAPQTWGKQIMGCLLVTSWGVDWLFFPGSADSKG